jgi:hypothetical protein
MGRQLRLTVGVWWVRSCKLHIGLGALYNNRIYTKYDLCYFIRGHHGCASATHVVSREASAWYLPYS